MWEKSEKWKGGLHRLKDVALKVLKRQLNNVYFCFISIVTSKTDCEIPCNE